MKPHMRAAFHDAFQSYFGASLTEKFLSYSLDQLNRTQYVWQHRTTCHPFPIKNLDIENWSPISAAIALSVRISTSKQPSFV